MIADGRVAIGGQIVETPATLIASLHGVTVDGKPVSAPSPARLFRFHKPAGLLTTERDPKGRPTIYDRLPQGLPRLMPVGRLDMNTEGLLLLTTDGGLKRQLELPATGVERTYRARAFGDISQERLEELIEGIEIEGVRYGPIDANLERRTGRNQWIELRLREGKNREVRRVLEHLGLQVSRLIRTAYGPFALADLPPGAVDEVRQHDLVAFKKTLSSSSPTMAADATRPSSPLRGPTRTPNSAAHQPPAKRGGGAARPASRRPPEAGRNPADRHDRSKPSTARQSAGAGSAVSPRPARRKGAPAGSDAARSGPEPGRTARRVVAGPAARRSDEQARSAQRTAVGSGQGRPGKRTHAAQGAAAGSGERRADKENRAAQRLEPGSGQRRPDKQGRAGPRSAAGPRQRDEQARAAPRPAAGSRRPDEQARAAPRPAAGSRRPDEQARAAPRPAAGSRRPAHPGRRPGRKGK